MATSIRPVLYPDTLIDEGMRMVSGNMTLEQVAELYNPIPPNENVWGDGAAIVVAVAAE